MVLWFSEISTLLMHFSLLPLSSFRGVITRRCAKYHSQLSFFLFFIVLQLTDYSIVQALTVFSRIFVSRLLKKGCLTNLGAQLLAQYCCTKSVHCHSSNFLLRINRIERDCSLDVLFEFLGCEFRGCEFLGFFL